jgi:Zn-dependent protease/predicted transcriptional regulator
MVFSTRTFCPAVCDMGRQAEQGKALMNGKRITLFKLFGFSVHLDPSWIFIALLVTWTLAAGFFPQQHEGLWPPAYWIMGLAGALGLFASIIFHEFWHSLVARYYGLQMKGITLFIFGGMAEMGEEPENPKTEFLMAVAGPISSVVLGFGFYLIYRGGSLFGWPDPVTGVIGYLAFINWLLAVFNLIPAFPLDGGRMLRSTLWGWKKDLRWATRTASRFGEAFGFFLMALGILSFFAGNLIAGVWYFIIGLFLRNAAQMSYQQLISRNVLGHEKVRSIMRVNPVAVPPDISLEQLVEDYFYKYHYKMFPVVDEDKLVGCISTRHLKDVPRNEWSYRPVLDVARSCSVDNTIQSDMEASKALQLMSRTGVSRLLVVEGDRLVGIIALKDILGHISAHMELGLEK